MCAAPWLAAVDCTVAGLGSDEEAGMELSPEEQDDLASYEPDPAAAVAALCTSCLLPSLVCAWLWG